MTEILWNGKEVLGIIMGMEAVIGLLQVFQLILEH